MVESAGGDLLGKNALGSVHLLSLTSILTEGSMASSFGVSTFVAKQLFHVIRIKKVYHLVSRKYVLSHNGSILFVVQSPNFVQSIGWKSSDDWNVPPNISEWPQSLWSGNLCPGSQGVGRCCLESTCHCGVFQSLVNCVSLCINVSLLCSFVCQCHDDQPCVSTSLLIPLVSEDQ